MTQPSQSGPTGHTPVAGQTVGPFYGYALPVAGGELLVAPGSDGAVRLHGTVTDGAGAPVPDALLEIWQHDGAGRVPQAQGSLRRGHEFTGFGRASTDGGGHYEFTTVVPGATEGRAPFFAMTVFARGLMNRLFTRVYLPEEADVLAADPLLSSLPDDRRATLVAQADGTDTPGGPVRPLLSSSFRFDVRLQGDDETVFLAFPRHQA